MLRDNGILSACHTT